MEKEILTELKMDSREEAVRFLKSLWNGTPQPLPAVRRQIGFPPQESEEKQLRLEMHGMRGKI